MKKSGLADSPFFDVPGPKKSPSPPRAAGKRKQTKSETRAKAQPPATLSPVDQSTDQPTSRPSDRLTDQLTDQPTDQSTDESTNVDALGAVVARPRSFYITQKLDRWLDEAVTYLKGKGLHKVDRSVLINALLHDPSLFEPGTLDRMRPNLLNHLTNKYLKRGQSTD